MPTTAGISSEHTRHYITGEGLRGSGTEVPPKPLPQPLNRSAIGRHTFGSSFFLPLQTRNRTSQLLFVEHCRTFLLKGVKGEQGSLSGSHPSFFGLRLVLTLELKKPSWVGQEDFPSDDG